jgi:hypothetical protein
LDYVVLDTCVLVNCSLVNAVGADPELLVTIFDKMRGKGVLLLLPEVIESEFIRKVPEELALIRAQSKKFRQAISTEVLPAPDVAELHAALDRMDSERQAAAARAQEYFASAADDPSLTKRVPLSGDIVAGGVSRVLSGRKPSRTGALGLLDPDSLIVASITLFARENGLSEEDTILLCSNNHKDFGTWSDEDDRHVIAKDIADSMPCGIRYYKSPRALVEEELKIVVEADPPLAAALDNYDQLSETLANVSATAAVTDYLTKFTDGFQPVDPEILERFRRMSQVSLNIDPEILERFRRMSQVSLNIAPSTDPGSDSPKSQDLETADGADDEHERSNDDDPQMHTGEPA